jgi:Tol biopolymer transport system component
MDADGSRPRRISDVFAEESDPSWSPDGELIAYIRRTPGTATQNVWVMRPDGSDRRALTRQDGRAFTPAWSPDGTRIVFSTNADSKVYELYTIGVDGKGLRQVVPTAGDNFEPSWSPDGSTIAYQEDGAIFAIELGSETPERLTDQSDNDSSPAWNPRPPADD